MTDTFVLDGSDASIENIRGSRDFGDFLIGSALDNTIEGLVGADFNLGGAGNDTIIGGDVEDVLQGGADNDTFVYKSTVNSEVGLSGLNLNFEATNNAEDLSLDSFFLTGVSSGASLTVGTGFAGTTASAKVTQLGDVMGDGKNDTLVEIDTTGNSFSDMEILLQNVTSTDVDTLDFTVT